MLPIFSNNFRDAMQGESAALFWGHAIWFFIMAIGKRGKCCPFFPKIFGIQCRGKCCPFFPPKFFWGYAIWFFKIAKGKRGKCCPFFPKIFGIQCRGKCCPFFPPQNFFEGMRFDSSKLLLEKGGNAAHFFQQFSGCNVGGNAALFSRYAIWFFKIAIGKRGNAAHFFQKKIWDTMSGEMLPFFPPQNFFEGMRFDLGNCYAKRGGNAAHFSPNFGDTM